LISLITLQFGNSSENKSPYLFFLYWYFAVDLVSFWRLHSCRLADVFSLKEG
tara:strand:- start:684 stop:839 length:156 start_codon:yes stop_codon:yes gene_type:complete